MRNFSDACERNKQPIIDVLDGYFEHINNVLEIGSGSGQHALYFVEHQPHLRWQSTDCEPYFGGLAANISRYGAPFGTERLPPARHLDVSRNWTSERYDGGYTANTLHIMSAQEVERLFVGLQGSIHPGGWLFIYGPFRYAGEYTSTSNADFDRWLKARDPKSGLRDFDWVQSLAETQGFSLVEDISMPANNQLLIWQRFV